MSWMDEVPESAGATLVDRVKSLERDCDYLVEAVRVARDRLASFKSPSCSRNTLLEAIQDAYTVLELALVTAGSTRPGRPSMS